MHNYLRAIGFSNLKNKKDIEDVMDTVLHSFDEQNISGSSEDSDFAEITKNFACNMGITVRGDYCEEDVFEKEYYFPHFYGTGVTTEEDITVERHAEKESYAGVCDDVKVGVSLIFYLQNVSDYLNELRKGNLPHNNISLTLSGLSLKGMVLLPVNKNEVQQKSDRDASNNRTSLIEAARKGDEDAIESLTLEDIDTYTMISRRITHEDVFTIVDSYFMPYGIECDQYNILGEILNFSLKKNELTQEEVYIINLSCNDLVFDVCINKTDLLGEPDIGRRFKGVIWLQGHINFPQ